jgi:hypothetical protein
MGDLLGPNPTMSRLEDQILWYDRKSVRSQQRFKVLKLLQIVSAAVIPVAAGLHAPAALTGGLGALIVVLEGIQQLNQYQQNWITYRSTCESLRHEKYLFLGRAGPYRHARDPVPLLANRIEGLISREHAKWESTQEEQTHQHNDPE